MKLYKKIALALSEKKIDEARALIPGGLQLDESNSHRNRITLRATYYGASIKATAHPSLINGFSISLAYGYHDHKIVAPAADHIRFELEKLLNQNC